jgi:hypothetical protein
MPPYVFCIDCYAEAKIVQQKGPAFSLPSVLQGRMGGCWIVDRSQMVPSPNLKCSFAICSNFLCRQRQYAMF